MIALTALGLVPSDPGLATIDIVFLSLWGVFGLLYWTSYRKTENIGFSFFKVAALLMFVYLVISGFDWLDAPVSPDQAITFGISAVPTELGPRVPLLADALTWFVCAILLLVVWYARGKFGTVGALILSTWDRGHWYMMPVILVLMTVGLLLVAAAASPVLSPFIYTLF